MGQIGSKYTTGSPSEFVDGEHKRKTVTTSVSVGVLVKRLM